MRNSIYSVSAFACVLTILCFSCTQEPTMLHRKFVDVITVYNPDGSSYQQSNCPTEGENCFIVCKSGLSLAQKDVLDAFYDAYHRNDLTNFFNSYDWPSIFPGLDVNSGIITGVRDGIYNLRLIGDDVAITTNFDPTFDANQVLISYKFDEGHCN